MYAVNSCCDGSETLCVNCSCSSLCECLYFNRQRRVYRKEWWMWSKMSELSWITILLLPNGIHTWQWWAVLLSRWYYLDTLPSIVYTLFHIMSNRSKCIAKLLYDILNNNKHIKMEKWKSGLVPTSTNMEYNNTVQLYVNLNCWTPCSNCLFQTRTTAVLETVAVSTSAVTQLARSSVHVTRVMFLMQIPRVAWVSPDIFCVVKSQFQVITWMSAQFYIVLQLCNWTMARDLHYL